MTFSTPQRVGTDLLYICLRADDEYSEHIGCYLHVETDRDQDAIFIITVSTSTTQFRQKFTNMTIHPRSAGMGKSTFIPKDAISEEETVVIEVVFLKWMMLTPPKFVKKFNFTVRKPSDFNSVRNLTPFNWLIGYKSNSFFRFLFTEMRAMD